MEQRQKRRRDRKFVFCDKCKKDTGHIYSNRSEKWFCLDCVKNYKKRVKKMSVIISGDVPIGFFQREEDARDALKRYNVWGFISTRWCR